MGKVLAPHNARPKTIPLINVQKLCGFSKYLIFPKISNKRMYKKNLKYFFEFLGPTRINPRSYVSPCELENQGYIVLYEKSIWKII